MKPNELFVLAIAAALLLMTQSCASVEYSADPIEAWVVDAETKQPIEGVIVVAHWELVGPMENYPVGQIEVLESVTDKNGRFHFPAWGPKLHLAPFRYLTDSDPELLFFKSGYKYISVSNSLDLRPKKYYYDGMPGGTKEKPTGSKRISFWNGETIEMKRFKGSSEEYVDHFARFNYDLGRIALDDPETCNWKKISQTIRVMNVERQRLEGLRIKPYRLSAIDNRLLDGDEYYIKKGGCGSPKEFFGGFQ
jgi:hypothetical protein